jgi:hypothetical protein
LTEGSAEEIYEQWSRAVGLYPGELFKLVSPDHRLVISGGAWDAYYGDGSGTMQSRMAENIERSVDAWLANRFAAQFVELRREMKGQGARIVRVTIHEDDPSKFSDAQSWHAYQERIEWLNQIYSRLFGSFEEVYWMPRSLADKLGAPTHDVSTFRLDRPESAGGVERAVSTGHNVDTQWGIASRDFIYLTGDDTQQDKDDVRNMLSLRDRVDGYLQHLDRMYAPEPGTLAPGVYTHGDLGLR